MLWLIVNPLGPAPDTDAAIVPVIVLALVFIPSSIITDFVAGVGWLAIG